MNHRYNLFLLTFLASCFPGIQLHSQSAAAVTQEIGVVIGPVAFLSDYGLRNNLSTNIGNSGKGIGLLYYLHLANTGKCSCHNRNTYFNDHFRLRAEVDYHKTTLKHYGRIAQSTTPDAGLLRAMIGNAEVYEVGAHLEYFPLSIRDYTAFAFRFTPFVSLGANYVGFNPGAYSTLGALNDHLFPSFTGGLRLENGSTWSIVMGGGIRFKLGVSSDLVTNMQWRYYESDWLDGLNHNQPQNKFNDMMFWLNAGYIYYLKF